MGVSFVHGNWVRAGGEPVGVVAVSNGSDGRVKFDGVANTTMKGRSMAPTGQLLSHTSQKMHCAGWMMAAWPFTNSTAWVGHSATHNPQLVQTARLMCGITSSGHQVGLRIL